MNAIGYLIRVPSKVMKTWIGMTAIAALLLAGCGTNTASDTGGTTGKGAEQGTTGASEPTGKKLKIGMVFDTGGLGDKSFNDSAYAGLTKAQTDLGVEVLHVQSASASEYGNNVEQLAGQGCDLVIAVGLGMNEAVDGVAPKFPDVKFAIVDGTTKSPNARGLLFKEEQGSFLAGYLAAKMSKTKKIGFVGGMEIPLIKKFQYGYTAGAYFADKTVEVLPAKYTMNWDSQDKGKASAVSLYGGGADIVYHAAGRAGLGVFKAAQEAGKWAIGVDSDQDEVAKGTVLTSMIKRVDEAVFQTIKDVQESKFTAGDKIYDIAANGVGLSEMKFTKDKVGADILAKLDEVRAKLVDGSLVAPATDEEYKAFLAKNP